MNLRVKNEGRTLSISYWWGQFSCIEGRLYNSTPCANFSGEAFPHCSVVKNLPAVQEMQETGVLSLDWEALLEEEMATHPVFLLGISYGQRRLLGYSLWIPKGSNMTEPLSILRKDTLHSPCEGHYYLPFSLRISLLWRWSSKEPIWPYLQPYFLKLIYCSPFFYLLCFTTKMILNQNAKKRYFYWLLKIPEI